MRSHLHSKGSPHIKQIAFAGTAIFLVAFGVRLLTWHDTRTEVKKVQSGVVADYQRTAQLLREGGFRGFWDPSGGLADPNLLGHPPGYAIVLAGVGALSSESPDAIQFFQITCDALAAVLIFLIAIELFPFAVGVIAGLLVGFSPQFAWNSVLLLPDTLAVLPLLIAVYFLTCAVRKPRFITVMAAGIFVGVSCWLRANALLMAPFLALVVLLLFQRRQRLRYAGALLAGALLIIAPLTIRNWIVFHDFIPVSLGAGQTMLEGISDYDPDRRFGIPNTDMGIMKMEAEQYNRPDYYSTLFAPDGIKRERMRLAQAFGVIRNNPMWFAGVMIRRAGSMLRLERARLISVGPRVNRQLTNTNERLPVWRATPTELIAGVDSKAPGVSLVLSGEGDKLMLTTDETKYGLQFNAAQVAVTPYHEYVFRFPILVEEGRMTVSVVGSGKVYVSGIVEKAEVKEGQPQPEKLVELPFVNGADEAVSLAFNNAAPESVRSIAKIGAVELFDLGPASFLWTRYPRLLIRGIQRLFITAIMLPLALIGIVVLVRRRAWQTLVLLLSVPAYYLCVQSMLHTEYRYVLAIHYFLFVLVAVALHEVWSVLINLRNSRRQSVSEAQPETQ